MSYSSPTEQRRKIWSAAPLKEFKRLVYLFDGRDPDALERARQAWTAAKAAGHDVAPIGSSPPAAPGRNRPRSARVPRLNRIFMAESPDIIFADGISPAPYDGAMLKSRALGSFEALVLRIAEGLARMNYRIGHIRT